MYLIGSVVTHKNRVCLPTVSQQPLKHILCLHKLLKDKYDHIIIINST